MTEDRVETDPYWRIPTDRGRRTECFKFQKLDVYKLALKYAKVIYSIRQKMPDHEKYNLTNQIERAVTSIVLNIAESSTG